MADDAGKAKQELDAEIGKAKLALVRTITRVATNPVSGSEALALAQALKTITADCP